MSIYLILEILPINLSLHLCYAPCFVTTLQVQKYPLFIYFIYYYFVFIKLSYNNKNYYWGNVFDITSITRLEGSRFPCTNFFFLFSLNVIARVAEGLVDSRLRQCCFCESFLINADLLLIDKEVYFVF